MRDGHNLVNSFNKSSLKPIYYDALGCDAGEDIDWDNFDEYLDYVGTGMPIEDALAETIPYANMFDDMFFEDDSEYEARGDGIEEYLDWFAMEKIEETELQYEESDYFRESDMDDY